VEWQVESTFHQPLYCVCGKITTASLFSKAAQAACYSLHRPTYPPELYAAILAKCEGRSLAVDIATGSGQAARALAEHFTKVIAQDGSAQQLQHADRQLANIEYQQADAHVTGLPGQCADLVTVAQALHWFDHPRFYREVRRILKPGACFAAWTYGLPTLCRKGHPANAVLWELYDGVLGSYWAEGRKDVEAAYRGIEPVQGQDFTHVERLTFETSRTARVGDLVGLVKSWSSYHTFLDQHPDKDPIHAFEQDMLAALQAQDTGGAQGLLVTQTMTLVLAKDPMPLH